MSRRKSDSALGKPQRRDSADKEELWPSANAVMANAVMIAEDFDDDCESDSADGGTNDSLLRMPKRYADSGSSSSSSRAVRPLPTSLVRALSDVAGKKAASSKLRSINKTMKALDKIRSRPQEDDRKSQIQELLDPMSPPTMPKRQASAGESFFLPELRKSRERNNTIELPNKQAINKEAGLLRPASIDFPESLRELPYTASL
jgi:hypothetical protein